MPKNTNASIKIDKNDREIIRLLQEDPRRTNADMARIIERSESTVKNRIDRMIDHGVISIHAQLNPRAFGYRHFFSVGMKVAPDHCDLLAQKLLGMSEVVYIGRALGRFDVMVDLVLQDTEHLNELLLQIVKSIPEVLAYESIYILEIKRLSYDWQLPKSLGDDDSAVNAMRAESKNRQVNEIQPLEIDELDAKIVRLLQENGRRTNADIARTLETNEVKVKKRIERIIAYGGLKIVTVINPKAIGFEVDAFISLKVSPHFYEEVEKELLALDEVVYLATITGEFGVLVEVLLTNTEKFLDFMSKTIHAIPGVDSTEINYVLRNHKMEYQWKLPPDYGVEPGAKRIRRASP